MLSARKGSARRRSFPKRFKEAQQIAIWIGHNKLALAKLHGFFAIPRLFEWQQERMICLRESIKNGLHARDFDLEVHAATERLAVG